MDNRFTDAGGFETVPSQLDAARQKVPEYQEETSKEEDRAGNTPG